jgi:hypothetical protein
MNSNFRYNEHIGRLYLYYQACMERENEDNDGEHIKTNDWNVSRCVGVHI